MLDTYLSLMNKKTEVWKRNTGGINTEPVIIPSGSHQEGAGLCQLREYEISSNMSLQPSNDRRLSGCSPNGCTRPIAPTTLETSKGWNPWSTTASQEWWEGKSSPLSSIMTLLQTIQRSSFPVGITVPTTCARSAHEQIHTPVVYSQGRRCIPSTPTRPSPLWSISPSMEKGTP